MSLITFSKPTNVFTSLKDKVNQLRFYVTHKLDALKTFELDKLVIWSRKFNRSQWCYFIAMSFLLFHGVFSEVTDFVLYITGAIAFVGLFREMWAMFQRIWSHNIGKAFVLILYAGTANLALAFAALKINIITGVEPMAFTFTLGFTTFVMLPFWIMISNILFLLMGLILANLLLFISIPIKLFGIRLSVHWEDTHRAGTTMVMRIILIPLVINMLMTVGTPYLAQLHFLSEGNTFTLNQEFGEPLSSENNQSKNAIVVLENDQFSLNLNPQNEDEIAINLATKNDDFEPNTEQGMFINHLIADFIYHFEAYQYSMCHKKNNERSMILDDFSTLLITQNPKSEFGYDYRVAACIPLYKATPSQ